MKPFTHDSGFAALAAVALAAVVAALVLALALGSASCW